MAHIGLTLQDAAILNSATGDLLNLGIVLDIDLLVAIAEILGDGLDGVESQLLQL